MVASLLTVGSQGSEVNSSISGDNCSPKSNKELKIEKKICKLEQKLEKVHLKQLEKEKKRAEKAAKINEKIDQKRMSASGSKSGLDESASIPTVATAEGTRFDLEKSILGSDGKEYLMGAFGIRHKKIFGMKFQVYLLGFYFEKEALFERIRTDEKNFLKMKKDGKLGDWLCQLWDVPAKIRMVWLRDVPRKMILDGFSDDIKKHLTKAERNDQLSKVPPLVPAKGTKEGKVWELTTVENTESEIATVASSGDKREPNFKIVSGYDGEELASVSAPGLLKAFPRMMLEDGFITKGDESLKRILGQEIYNQCKKC